jgi:hypothetical protein
LCKRRIVPKGEYDKISDRITDKRSETESWDVSDFAFLRRNVADEGVILNVVNSARSHTSSWQGAIPADEV